MATTTRSPRLGQLAVEKDLVSEDELAEALRVQEETGRPLGEVLTELLGVLSIAAMRDLLLVQRRWRPLGQMLIDRGLLTDEQLRAALTEQKHKGEPLGEILRARYALSPAALDSVLADQHELELELERGFGSGLRGALARNAESHIPADRREFPAPSFGFAERIAIPAASEAHTHLAVRNVQMAQKKIDALNALIEQQAGELNHLREALTDRDLAVIELEQRVAELEGAPEWDASCAQRLATVRTPAR